MMNHHPSILVTFFKLVKRPNIFVEEMEHYRVGNQKHNVQKPSLHTFCKHELWGIPYSRFEADIWKKKMRLEV